MSDEKLLKKLLTGSHQNIRFQDFIKLVGSYDFTLDRIKGSHHIYIHLDTQSILNLQPLQGKVKAYQVRQFLVLIERHQLKRRPK